MRKVTSANPMIWTLLVALTAPLLLFAQEKASTQKPRYRLEDLGTFGGPTSLFFEFNNNLNSYRGLATNCADTANLDPDFPNVNPLFGGDPYIQHAFRATSEGLTDLGALAGGTSSCGQGINVRGHVAGYSSNGGIDQHSGTPEIEGVLWRDGEIIDLGNFGGGNSYAAAINDRDQVAGNAYNSIPDPYSGQIFFFGATQVHAFLWQDGHIQDLGTLGGPDSIAVYLNERGDVAGFSLTNSTPNATTGIPTIDPFLWSRGKMQDLGTLGGTIGIPNGLNNRGQVVGFSNLAGDQAGHAFFWERGALKDMGTLGGSFSSANGLNDQGVVVGQANLAGDSHWDAFLWENGKMRDLGNLGCASNAFAINSRKQVVGTSLLSDCATLHSTLWQEGKIYDLNDLIPPGSGFELLAASYINETGVIAGIGRPPRCTGADDCLHAFLLFPQGDSPWPK